MSRRKAVARLHRGAPQRPRPARRMFYSPNGETRLAELAHHFKVQCVLVASALEETAADPEDRLDFAPILLLEVRRVLSVQLPRSLDELLSAPPLYAPRGEFASVV